MSRFTKHQLETVEAMLAKDHQMIAIAHDTGIHLHDIQRIAKAANDNKLQILIGQRRKLTPADRQELLKKYNRSNKTQSQFARENDVCVSTLNSIIRAAKEKSQPKTADCDYLTLDKMICIVKQTKPMLTQAWV